MLNRVYLIGHLGDDPEVHESKRGDKIVSFRMATTKKWRDQMGDRRERTEWHRCVVFDKLLIETAETFKKGTRVYVQGELATRQYDKDGITRYATEVVLPMFNGVLINLDMRQQYVRDGAQNPDGYMPDEAMEDAYGPREKAPKTESYAETKGHAAAAAKSVDDDSDIPF